MEEGESNYFSEPRFASVIDRYYTRWYRRVTPASISQMLEIKMGEEELTKLTEAQRQERDTAVLDQYYFVHSNKLVLFGLSEKHEAVVGH